MGVLEQWSNQVWSQAFLRSSVKLRICVNYHILASSVNLRIPVDNCISGDYRMELYGLKQSYPYLYIKPMIRALSELSNDIIYEYIPNTMLAWHVVQIDNISRDDQYSLAWFRQFSI